MTPRESHARFTTFQQKMEEKFIPPIYSVIDVAIKRFLQDNPNFTGANDVHLTGLIPEMRNLYYQCGYGYGWSVYKQYRSVKSIRHEYEPAGIQTKTARIIDIQTGQVTPQSIAQEVLNELRMSLIVNANLIENTVRERILYYIDQGQLNGWGYEKTAQQIEGIVSIVRARRIVRTESVKVSNMAGITGARNTNILMDKRWISARDNRVRGNPAGKYPMAEFDHWDINGTVLPMDQAFLLGSRNSGVASDSLQYPGDPNGSAADLINCFLPHQKTSINPAIVKRAFRSWYNGETVVIKLASGNEIACTVNHPILTFYGTVKAGELTNTHSLIKSEFLNKISSKLNVNNIPSTCEQAFNSLSVSGVSMRQRRSLVNFYGDIPASDVDIVNTKRTLRNSIKSINYKNIVHFIFRYTYFRACNLLSNRIFKYDAFKVFFRHASNFIMRSINQSLSFFRRSLRHSFVHRFASVSGLNANIDKPLENSMTGAIKFDGQSFNAHTGIKQRDDFLARQFSVKPVFDFNVINSKEFGNLCSTSMIDFCNGLNADTRFVEIDNIVSIERQMFSGRVYTFETELQMYDVSGIVAKNCRCSLGFIPKRDANGRVIRTR